jgi:hypothetical protein
LGNAAVRRFAAGLLIEISFGFTALVAATTEAPPRPPSRRGRIPEHIERPELNAVPLRWSEKASLFWIILLLV